MNTHHTQNNDKPSKKAAFAADMIFDTSDMVRTTDDTGRNIENLPQEEDDVKRGSGVGNSQQPFE